MSCWRWLPLLVAFSGTTSCVLDILGPPDVAPSLPFSPVAHSLLLLAVFRTDVLQLWGPCSGVLLAWSTGSRLSSESYPCFKAPFVFFFFLKGRKMAKHSFFCSKTLRFYACSALSCGFKFTPLSPCQPPRHLSLALPCHSEWWCDILSLWRPSSHILPGAINRFHCTFSPHCLEYCRHTKSIRIAREPVWNALLGPASDLLNQKLVTLPSCAHEECGCAWASFSPSRCWASEACETPIIRHSLKHASGAQQCLLNYLKEPQALYFEMLLWSSYWSAFSCAWCFARWLRHPVRSGSHPLSLAFKLIMRQSRVW